MLDMGPCRVQHSAGLIVQIHHSSQNTQLGTLHDVNRAILAVWTIGASIAINTRATVRARVATAAAWPGPPAEPGSTAKAAAAALCVAVYRAGDDALGHDGDVAAVAAIATGPTITTARAIATVTTIRAGISRVGGKATFAAGAATTAATATTTITSSAAARVDIDADDEIVNLDGDVAAEFTRSTVIAARTRLSIAAGLSILRSLVAIPVIDAVSTFLSALARLTR